MKIIVEFRTQPDSTYTILTDSIITLFCFHTIFERKDNRMTIAILA